MLVNTKYYTEFIKKYPSLMGILFSNALILLYVIFMGATSAEILILYWFESLIIGFFTVLKMLVVDWDFSSTAHIILFCLKFLLIPFFMFHYGIFMSVHMTFIMLLTSGVMVLGYSSIFSSFSNTMAVISVPLIFLFLSHMYSFIFNFVMKEEYKRINSPQLMMQPYSRIFVMQFVLIFGVFLSMLIAKFFGLQYFQAGIISLFIVVKTYFDIKSHVKEREFNHKFEIIKKLFNI